jgi:hypoxanthine phosphoribosyltransferase|tara:strand:- start:885 stop:1328 length:444 start_codon:yes stop_codon:yes gene_type:complete
MEKHSVPYNEINFYSRMLARRVEENREISHVVGLARGGLIPATIMSYALDKPLLSYGISSYKGSKKTENFHITQTFSLVDLPRNASLLVVDDICDTGDTMKHITEKLALAGIRYTTACVYTKEKHKDWLDYFGLVVDDNKWIVFPWE